MGRYFLRHLIMKEVKYETDDTLYQKAEELRKKKKPRKTKTIKRDRKIIIEKSDLIPTFRNQFYFNQNF